MKKVITVLLVLVVSAGFAFAGEKARDGRFISYDDGTIRDTQTGLMWAAKDNGGGINWANAKSYCENYRGGGYTDWRMPTQDELAGLFDPKVTGKNYGLHLTNLIDFTHAYGWASDTRGSEVASFNFQGDGKRDWRPRSYDDGCERALPVRSGKIVKQSPHAVQAGDGLQPLSPPSDPVVVSSFNTGGVQSGPTYTMAFVLKVPYRITYMHNYHYFNNGKLPGTVALRHDDGTMYGPWQAEGAAGYGNMPNGYWVVRPNIEIKSGRYTVIDSDKSTWSYNSQSKGSGFVEIRGVKLSTQEAPQYKPQVKQEEPAVASSVGEKARDDRFIAYDNGTVLDTKTGLMWAAKDNGSDINWHSAKSYCINYRGGGYTNWRMPTSDELTRLYDREVSGYHGENCPGITKLIKLTDCSPWASETRGSEAAYFSFNKGLQVWVMQSATYGWGWRALPVRSSK